MEDEVGFAEELDKVLGTASVKATAWLKQRKAMLDQLIAVRDKAIGLIRALSGENGSAVDGIQQVPTAEQTPGRPRNRLSRPAAHSKHRKRSRPPLSAEARGRIAAAQRERWAKVRNETKK